MAIYSLALPGTVTTNAAPSWDVKAASTNEPAVMELGVINGAATACTCSARPLPAPRLDNARAVDLST
jgi:hypothetical protein